MTHVISCSAFHNTSLLPKTLFPPPQAGPASLVAGSVFGFLCCLLAGGDAFLKFRGWREGRLAQGERRVTSTSSNHQTTY